MTVEQKTKPAVRKLDRELLVDMLKWAETEERRRSRRTDESPEDGLRWGQEYWIVDTAECGTVCCVAGWVALTRGWHPLRKVIGGDWLPESFEVTKVEGATDRDGVPARLIKDVAKEELGVGSYDAERLFSGGNNLADLRRVVADILNEYEDEEVHGG